MEKMKREVHAKLDLLTRHVEKQVVRKYRVESIK